MRVTYDPYRFDQFVRYDDQTPVTAAGVVVCQVEAGNPRVYVLDHEAASAVRSRRA